MDGHTISVPRNDEGVRSLGNGYVSQIQDTSSNRRHSSEGEVETDARGSHGEDDETAAVTSPDSGFLDGSFAKVERQSVGVEKDLKSMVLRADSPGADDLVEKLPTRKVDI